MTFLSTVRSDELCDDDELLYPMLLDMRALTLRV